MITTIKNVLGRALILMLLPILSCSENPKPEYQSFPGFSIGTLNGNSFDYQLSGYGRGSEYSYSTSFEPLDNSESFGQSLTVRFKTNLCSENCEWKPTPSEDLMEVINSVDWILSSSEEQGVSIIYLDGAEEIYYSDINAELYINNRFKLDTAYITEYDMRADFKEPYEKIIIVEGRFFSTLTNANDYNDQIIIEADFKGFLDSESEW